MEPYRVDRDPFADVPIESVEHEIRRAVVCLADITVDNPNVWYELGFASAMGKPVVLVCSTERTGKRFPFDIQHRAIIEYESEAPRDFDRLRKAITVRIKAHLEQGAALRQIASTEQLANVEGLSQTELLVLATVAGNVPLHDEGASLHFVQREAEQVGLTNLGFTLGLRRLMAKQFISSSVDVDRDGEYQILTVTELGWEWIDGNEELFVIKRDGGKRSDPDDVPF